MRIVLIPCGATEWSEEGRLLGRVELPLLPKAHAQCAAWARVVADAGVSCIYHGADDLSTQTALQLACHGGATTKALGDLAEVDLGLWTGLTEAQVRQRFASAHRELKTAPWNVHPPEGESLRGADQRLRACLQKQAARNGTRAIGLVLRPFSLALMRCALGGSAPDCWWDAFSEPASPVVIEAAAPLQLEPRDE